MKARVQYTTVTMRLLKPVNAKGTDYGPTAWFKFHCCVIGSESSITGMITGMSSALRILARLPKGIAGTSKDSIGSDPFTRAVEHC